MDATAGNEGLAAARGGGPSQTEEGVKRPSRWKAGTPLVTELGRALAVESVPLPAPLTLGAQNVGPAKLEVPPQYLCSPFQAPGATSRHPCLLWLAPKIT